MVGSGANKGANSGAAAGGAGAAKPADPKPVECNLCHRKFKNIPALNGHMRLHGGYFKKDSESKKSDKKDCGGPPLQTASVSVRALIEEKIIQKRITNPALAAQQQPPPQYPGTPPGSGGNSKTGFAIPAAPSPVPPPEKTRRHSDSAEHFAQPPRSDPVNVKRVQRQSSEPTNSGVGSPLALALAAELAAAEQAGANANSYGLAAAFANAGAGAGFFHQDDVFQQVPEAVLQLAESIQAEEMAALEEFHEAANSPSGGGGFSTGGAGGADGSNADFPPLQPVTLADLAAFSAAAAVAAHKEAATVYAYSPSSHHKETATVYAYSPQPQNSKDATGYTFSPHTASPLPSPLQAHDSPSFAYPTPPASQEGPSFGLLQQAPLGSPHASAADSTFTFYAGALSPSAAAVEAALNEVLPGESLSRTHHTLLYHSAPAVPSPPPSGAVNSPLSATPVPSPLSSVPASSSSAPSPLPPTSASNNQYSLQSQMMPNSDDPLLSSSPKDFGGRKRFDFGVFRNGSVDTTSATLHSLGLVVDSSGELRFYPTSGAASPAVTSTTSQPQHRGNNGGCNNNQRGPLEAEDDVFLSPTSVPASPIPRLKRPRPRPEPLYIPTPHQPPQGPALYPSRMRPSRMRPCAGSGAGQPCSNVHFTPQPMLDPSRQGQGLYNCLQVKNEPNSSHGGVDEAIMDTDTVDVVPHINVGSRHQVTCLPVCEPRQELAQLEPNKEHLLWDPGIAAGEGEIDMYLEFACCAAVPGGGRNKEYALHLLHMCHGNIHEAMLKLMQPTPALPAGHPLLSYCYSDSARWAADEVEAFQQALVRHGKDFRNVAKEVSTKSETQCVQFYYLWKKVCPEEYQRLRLLRQRPDLCILKGIDLDELANDRLSFQASDAEVISSTCTADTRLFMCEYPDCSASFNSRAALNGHVRIHGGGGRRSPTPDGCRGRPLSGTPPIEGGEEFPCKVCGKVFGKVKSRSAHMKSHRPPDAEPKRPKNDQQHQQQQHQQSLREDCRGAPGGMMSANLPVGLGLMQ
ncbi:hypothetical protein B566_EDAN001134 [Ephemera danica]|nr:hypothetical protein B566_EDAN001134 [Ephemera danica]